MITRSTELGTEISLKNRLILFGNRNSSFKTIQEKYPKTLMKRIRQVHGDHIVETGVGSPDYQIEADAQWTKDSNLGLCISTADCCPVVLIAPQCIANIHAGWRGVENRILPKTLEVWRSHGISNQEISIFVGPHIQRESFEVQKDVKDLLLNCFQDRAKEKYFESKSDGKFLIDLHLIVKQQIIEFGIDPDKVYFEKINTVTDLNYHSFRRDKENSGRQISMVFSVL